MFEEKVTSGIVRCVVNEINQLTRKSNTNSYEIGLLMVQHTKGKSPEYRSEFISKIVGSDKLECSRSLVYDAYAVISYFPDYTPDDPLTFSHHVQLTRLENDLERTEFKRRAIEENWSVRRLRAEVRAYLKSGSSMEDALEACLGHIRRAWALLGRWRGEIQGQVSKGLVVSAGLVAENATKMAMEARSISARLTERWEEQISESKKVVSGITQGGATVMLQPEDYRLVGVIDDAGCKQVLFPKDKPLTSLHNVFRAAKYLLQLYGLADVELQYRAGVWATHYN